MVFNFIYPIIYPIKKSSLPEFAGGSMTNKKWFGLHKSKIFNAQQLVCGNSMMYNTNRYYTTSHLQQRQQGDCGSFHLRLTGDDDRPDLDKLVCAWRHDGGGCLGERGCRGTDREAGLENGDAALVGLERLHGAHQRLTQHYLDMSTHLIIVSFKKPYSLCIPLYVNVKYCDIIFYCCAFNFMYFIGRTIHELKIPKK